MTLNPLHDILFAMIGSEPPACKGLYRSSSLGDHEYLLARWCGQSKRFPDWVSGPSILEAANQLCSRNVGPPDKNIRVPLMVKLREGLIPWEDSEDVCDNAIEEWHTGPNSPSEASSLQKERKRIEKLRDGDETEAHVRFFKEIVDRNNSRRLILGFLMRYTELSFTQVENCANWFTDDLEPPLLTRVFAFLGEYEDDEEFYLTNEEGHRAIADQVLFHPETGEEIKGRELKEGLYYFYEPTEALKNIRDQPAETLAEWLGMSKSDYALWAAGSKSISDIAENPSV